MAYTASALSLLLQGCKRPIVMTGSQMPLAAPRSDARSNLLGGCDSGVVFGPLHWLSFHVQGAYIDAVAVIGSQMPSALGWVRHARWRFNLRTGRPSLT